MYRLVVPIQMIRGRCSCRRMQKGAAARTAVWLIATPRLGSPAWADHTCARLGKEGRKSTLPGCTVMKLATRGQHPTSASRFGEEYRGLHRHRLRLSLAILASSMLETREGAKDQPGQTNPRAWGTSPKEDAALNAWLGLIASPSSDGDNSALEVITRYLLTMSVGSGGAENVNLDQVVRFLFGSNC
jgi:hypothetical protein